MRSVEFSVDLQELDAPPTVVEQAVEVSVDLQQSVVASLVAQQEITLNYDVAYLVGGGGGTGSVDLQGHIDNPTPHTAYDVEMPSLAVIFRNGLV